MKKIFKRSIVIIGILILLAIGLNSLIKAYLSSDRVKMIILPKAESLTGRKVTLQEIQVSLFKGIVAKELSIKEKDEKRDFLKVKEFILSYRLLPLLRKQLVLSKIVIGSPSITILRERGGRYNFSDMMERRPKEPQRPSPPKGQGLPISIVADKFFIRDARFMLMDEEKKLPDVSATFDAEVKGRVGKDGTPQMEFGRLFLKEVKVDLKDQGVKAWGKIEVDPKTLRANLQTQIGEDRIDLSATVKDYLTTPDAIANLHAKTLDLQKLSALGREKKPSEGEPKKKEISKKRGEERKVERLESDSLKKLKAQGQIAIDVATYQDYTLKDFRLSYQYAKGVVKIDPIGLRFFGGEAFTGDGSLHGNFQFAGEEVLGIQKTLRGRAEANLGKGAIKKSEIFDAISMLTGIAELKNPGFDRGLFHFDVREEKVYLNGFLQSSLFKISPRGMVDFEKKMDLPTELKISPRLTKGLGKRFASIKFLEDEEGWKTIPLKIKGTVDDPKVSLDEEALMKQLGPTLKKGLERLLEKQTSEEKKSSKKKEKGILQELLE